MQRRSRPFRLLKWGGLLACLLIAAAWCLSSSYCVKYAIGRTAFGLHGGACAVWVRTVERDEPGWTVEPGVEDSWLWPESFRGAIGTSIIVPLWMPLLVCAALTGLLGRCDRPLPPGHCRSCGYNLRGNTSGRCPE